MLKLFQSIFTGGEDRGRYPEWLIEAATERAVDATDARLRALSGLRKRLREPVIHAIDHVISLVDSLPEPLAADSGSYAADPRLSTLFASVEHMREVFGNDPELSEFRRVHPQEDAPVTTLLLAERVEKRVMGMELAGETVQRDVAQVAVSFRGHRLLDPATGEEEARRQLKRRAFDHLLSLALLRITETQSERTDLKRQRDLLQRKLRDLQRGGGSFADASTERADHAELQADLDEVEAQLATLGVDQDVLNAHLEITAGLLAEAEKNLWSADISLYLDPMNIQRDAGVPSARAVRFQEISNARGQGSIMLLLAIAPGSLPQREDFFSAAQRYLA